MDEEDFEISIQPSPKKKSTSKRNRKSKKASDSKVEKVDEKNTSRSWSSEVRKSILKISCDEFGVEQVS